MRQAVLAFVGLCAAYVAFRYALALRGGGQYWTTGDWLINYSAGFVRRGLSGALTFGIADLTGASIIAVAGAMQLAIYAAMVGLVLWCFASIRTSAPIVLLLISPVFLLMPFYHLKLAMVKETVGFLGLALMAATMIRGRVGLLWAGVAVLALSGFVHEINAFLAAGGVALIALFRHAGLIGRRAALAAAAVVLGSALAALAAATVWQGHGLSAAICGEVLRRGGDPIFCDPEGPIMWLERDAAYGVGFTWQENVESGVWPLFVGGYLLSIAPFFLFRPAGKSAPALTAAAAVGVVLGILAFAPLFVVASDWGRWIAMYVFALTLVAVAAVRLGYIEPRVVAINPLVILLGLVWSMPDFGGADFTAGMLTKVERLITGGDE